MARQQRLSTILERGFSALDDWDFDAAESALLQAQRIDRHDARVLELEGELHLIAEDPAAAADAFRKAVAGAPEALSPKLGLGRALLMLQVDVEDDAEKRKLVDEIIELLAAVPESSDEYPETLLAQLGALACVVGKHAKRDALVAQGEALVADVHDWALDAAMAVATFDLPRALAWLDIAARDEELRADALHVRGSLLADADRRDEMIAAWTEVWKLDNAEGARPPRVSITFDDLEEIAQEALNELPAELRERLRRAAILLDDAPSPEMVAEGVDPRSLGLFTGTPTSEESSGPPALTHIHLFKCNLEHAAYDEEELVEQVRITLWHETAHFFGLDEDAVAALGLE